MKKMFRNLMLVAVAAMASISCQKEADEVTTLPQDVVMTIIADMDETRTYIDEANSNVKWSEGDQIKVLENSAVYRTSEAATIDASGKASFKVSFPADATSASFTYDAIFPADRFKEDDKDKINLEKVKVEVPEAQNPTATSFDPAADILVAKHVVKNTQPTALSMQFKRLVALGKMTMKNFPSSASNINKVIFTANVEDAEGKPLAIAGRNYVNVETGDVVEYGYYGATNTIILSYDNASPSTPIYFTCNPFELTAGQSFTVKVVCSDYTYTREVVLNKNLKFSEGDLSTFSVDMSTATKEKSFTFANGDYAVIAVANSKYYALSSAANGKRLNAVEVSFNGGNSLTTADETLKWTVTKSNNGYTFKGSNNQYVAWDGSVNHYAHTQDEAYYLDITEDADNAGRYFVASKADVSRKLQKNNTNNYFAFYASAQSGSLYLVPVTIDPNAGGNEGGEVVKATVAKFLAAAEDSTIYELTGEITSVTNTEYGNFYLKDSTGEVLIYGLCSPTGAQKYWAESGAKEGDTITVQTVRSSHNGTPQGKNAIFVSLVPGEGGNEGGGDSGDGDIITIAEALAVGSGKTIGGIIEGVVISNYELNNLTSKKGMYVQDETGALQFYLGANHEFAFGTKVRIDLTSATLGAYNGAVQVSGIALDKITEISTGNTVTPKTVTMADFLANKYEGQYIALEGVQVAASDLSKTWVSGDKHTSINMEDANGNKFVVFSSKYASYGASTVAQGSGTIKGISSINNGTIQIIFAQESDFAGLTGERFGDDGGDDSGDDSGDEGSTENVVVLTMSDYFSAAENVAGNTYTFDGFSFSFVKVNSSISNYHASDGGIRFYKGDKLTIDANGKTMTQIEFTTYGGKTGPVSSDVGSCSNNVWTGNAGSVTFTADNQIRFSKVTITIAD